MPINTEARSVEDEQQRWQGELSFVHYRYGIDHSDKSDDPMKVTVSEVRAAFDVVEDDLGDMIDVFKPIYDGDGEMRCQCCQNTWSEDDPEEHYKDCAWNNIRNKKEARF